MQTNMTSTSPQTVNKWSASLFRDITKKSYFEQRFIGVSQNNCIQRLTDLERESGDTIKYDLSVRLRGRPTYGDERLENKQEQLKFYQDQVSIDQVRKSVSAGGVMTRKRTKHDLRTLAREKLSEYFATFMDEMYFMTLSGARGINQDFIESLDFTGFAGNGLTSPDAAHILYGGDAESKADIVETDYMSRTLIERASVQAKMMQAKDASQANMVPLMIGGEARYVCVMSPFQEHYMRTEDSAGWLDIQKAVAAAKGDNNKIYRGGLGMINNVVLHSHQSVIRFNDYGADSDVPVSRALFLGAQAGVVAFGSPNGGSRFDWKEKLLDFDAEPVIAAGAVFGTKKSTFRGKDFGVMALDTAAPDPSPTAN